MNLAIFTVSKIHEEKDMIYFSDPFLFFAMNLADHFDSSLFFCPGFPDRFNDLSGSDYYRLKKLSGPIEIIEGYPSKGMTGFFLKLPLILIRDIKKYINVTKEADVVFLRLPSPACLIAFPMAKFYRKSIVSYYASDIKTVVFSGSKYKGTMKWIARFAADFIFRLFKLLVKNSDTAIFLSKELMNKHRHKNKYYAFASILKKEEIIFKNTGIFAQKEKMGLVYAGRLTHEKGLKYLLKAMPLLLQNKHQVCLTLCGDGPQRSELEQMVVDLGVEEYVEFKGHVSSRRTLGDIFSNHDVFVLPSISEGTPKVLIEAMAKGLIIVASNIGGIPNVVTNYWNGILVKEKSGEEIARAVKSVVNNKSLCEKLIANGYEFAREHTMECQARKIAEIIHSTRLQNRSDQK